MEPLYPPRDDIHPFVVLSAREQYVVCTDNYRKEHCREPSSRCEFYSEIPILCGASRGKYAV